MLVCFMNTASKKLRLTHMTTVINVHILPKPTAQQVLYQTGRKSDMLKELKQTQQEETL